MKIYIIQVGKTHHPAFQAILTEYLERLKHYTSIEEIIIGSVTNVAKMPVPEILRKESELLLKVLKGGFGKVILLDEKGKTLSSAGLAAQIEKWQLNSLKSIAFVIGGAYGFHDDVYKLYTERISLSAMTFSHQMIRLLLTEQLYRAFTIIKGEKYHHA